MTLVEMTVALSIMAIIFAVVLPQFRAIQNSWDSKAGAAEALQNGRVLMDHLYHNLSKATRISAVSDSSETDGYIEFKDNAGSTLGYDIGADSYVEFGPVGSLSELAGPVSQLQFACYDACDLDAPMDPITDVNLIRFVKVETTLTNSAALGQDRTLTTSAYLRTNSSSSCSSNKMYWSDEEVDKIRRANLDGSNIEDLVSAAVMKPKALALDVAGGKMYWADEEVDKIRRANLNGSNIEDLVTAAVMKPRALALDVASGKMYWSDEEVDKIRRANLDGSNIEDLVSAVVMKPKALALDVTGGKMYWADEEVDKIRWANLDGSNIEDLVSAAVMKPRALALDVTGGKMYWADEEIDKIQRANLDGSNIEDLVTAAIMKPRALALDPDSGDDGGCEIRP